jgi:hypothetical protein
MRQTQEFHTIARAKKKRKKERKKKEEKNRALQPQGWGQGRNMDGSFLIPRKTRLRTGRH